MSSMMFGFSRMSSSWEEERSRSNFSMNKLSPASRRVMGAWMEMGLVVTWNLWRHTYWWRNTNLERKRFEPILRTEVVPKWWAVGIPKTEESSINVVKSSLIAECGYSNIIWIPENYSKSQHSKAGLVSYSNGSVIGMLGIQIPTVECNKLSLV